MTNSSLSITHDLNNAEIENLAQLFAIVLQYYNTHNSPSEKDYLKQLHMLVGLGFTTILIDRSFLPSYQPLFIEFLSQHYLEANPMSKERVLYTIAKIISGGVYVSKFTGDLPYLPIFMHTLKIFLNHIAIKIVGKEAESERLLILLNQR